ncbi:MAG: type II toxin-antitoxin system RatA family toxin [Pseudomonadales bacterium]
MTRIERTALVPWSPVQMFDVVDDVESYPEFLPWCASAELLSRTETEIIGRLKVSKGQISQSLTTRNRLDRPHSMTIDLVDGPFKSLSGQWTFVALGDEGCKVQLDMDFEFDNRLVSFTFGKLFGSAADRLVDAFCNRASELYGSDHR